MQTPLQGAFRCVWMQNRVFLLMYVYDYRCQPTGPVVFSHDGDHISSPWGPVGPQRTSPCICLRGACGRVWVSLLYVSMNCLLTFLRYYCLRYQARGIFPMDSACLIFPMKR